MSSESAFSLVLPQRLEVAQASALRATLIEALRRQQPLVIDGSQVESIDSASAQVLAAVVCSARETRTDVTWKRSEALDGFLSRIGLLHFFSAERASYGS
jgi:anti-anti-sigma regulatory factor